MKPNRAPWNSWSDAELTTLTRLHAEGLTNPEIYPSIPGRTPAAITAKMEALNLERNISYAWRKSRPIQEVIVTDPWCVKVQFEDQPIELRRPDPTPGNSPATWWRKYVNDETRSPCGNAAAMCAL